MLSAALLSMVLSGPAPVPRELVFGPPLNPIQLLRTRLFPIGFSRTGKLAVVLEPADEACGCYFATFLILDLVKDEPVESVRYVSDDATTFPVKVKTPPTDFATFWRLGLPVWKQKLDAHGIVPRALTLEPPRAHGLSLSVSRCEADAGCAGAELVASSTRGRKSLTTWPLEADERVLSREVRGVLRSPFERRVAALVVETRMGWEGPPHVEEPKLIGCHLERGFSR